MLSFFRCLLADIRKKKRTSFIWMHVTIPFICAGFFLLYFCHREHQPYQLYRAYIEAIAVALPLLIGIVCGMTASLEEQAGKFQVLLGRTSPKFVAYVSKMTLLLFMNICAIYLAIGLYLLGLRFLFHVPNLPYFLFLEGGAWLVAGSVALYFIYFLISCTIGMGASVLLGGAGLLLTALMNTGLGDAIWKYNPWAWGIRLAEYKGIEQFSQVEASFITLLHQEINSGALIMAFAIIALFIVSIIWFSRWEGKKAYE
ncbi:lantibiotic immunity ABC transporter MutG family permease subunit [Bacillus sp. z60-18]|uniref:lantibiotic immunity ABC transporter MutG family permease subunit n=1 Tax=unclassified Bacillus (in: firmicutes) TaxID=185979 RepID=UPI00240932C0|nr:lantibiotic immunity ABC transporter MutG family permease subunit [Bacillus sp. HSf4]WFA05620.1 lantibiotic immunity ABC transporter MutG family permease subunit [Bacillus sp. HSf4]